MAIWGSLPEKIGSVSGVSAIAENTVPNDVLIAAQKAIGFDLNGHSGDLNAAATAFKPSKGTGIA